MVNGPAISPMQDGDTRLGEITLTGMAIVLLRQRRLVVAVVAASLLVVVIGALATSPTWTASFAFLPGPATDGASRIGGLAAQLGVPGLAQPSGLTPEVYSEIARSYQVLESVARARYTLPVEQAGTDDLLDYFEIPMELSPEERTARAVRRLRDAVGASVASRTGLVTIAVKVDQPDIAFAIATQLLSEINSFNRQSRQEQARAERIFLEGRLAEVEKQLRQAENDMQQFLERNREWERAPGPRFEHDRLQRELLMRQQAYIALSQSYEQTRLNEVRDTPAMTVIEAPVRPVRPDGRRLAVRGVLAIILGTMLGVTLAFVRDRGQRMEDQGDPDFDALKSQWRATLRDLTFWRRRSATGE